MHGRSLVPTLALAFLAMTPVVAQEIVNFDIRERSCIAHDESTWGYYGQVSPGDDGGRRPILLPNDWGQSFEACGRHLAALHRQSPIELPAETALSPADPAAVEIVGRGTVEVIVEHNCHTVQATLQEAGAGLTERLRIDGQAYTLIQFHLHTPSEHVLNAGPQGTTNYPGEIHFVHAAVRDDGELDQGRLAVLGVFIDLASEARHVSEDGFFRELAARYDPAQPDSTSHSPISADLGTLRLENHKYWRYQGSLTTPPCTESVEWIVLAEPLVLSMETYRLMQQARLDVGFANARPAFIPTKRHNLRFTAPLTPDAES